MPGRVACSVGCKVRRARGPPARALCGSGPTCWCLTRPHASPRRAAAPLLISPAARGSRGGEQAHGSWRAHAARAGAVCVPCVRCPQYMCCICVGPHGAPARRPRRHGTRRRGHTAHTALRSHAPVSPRSRSPSRTRVVCYLGRIRRLRHTSTTGAAHVG